MPGTAFQSNVANPLISNIQGAQEGAHSGALCVPSLMSSWQNNEVEENAPTGAEASCHLLTKRPRGPEVMDHLFSIGGQNFF